MRSSPADPRQPGGPLPGFSLLRPRRAVALLLLLLVWVSCCLGALCACRSCESCVAAHVAVDFRVNPSGYKTGTSSTLNNIVVHLGAMVVGVCCIAA